VEALEVPVFIPEKTFYLIAVGKLVGCIKEEAVLEVVIGSVKYFV